MADRNSITRRAALKAFPAIATTAIPAAALAFENRAQQDPTDVLVHHLKMVVRTMNEIGTKNYIGVGGNGNVVWSYVDHDGEFVSITTNIDIG